MNKNEVTLSLFTDYSKAFNTVHLKTLLHKRHSLQFSHSSLHLMNSYLTERKQFVQFDDKRSPLARVYFGVPQGATVYRYCKVKDITENAKLLEASINSLESWSKKSNLVFNADETKTIPFSTCQMSQKHNLDNPELYTIKSKDTIIEREVTWKVLGIKSHQNSSWKDHVTTLTTESYSTLRTLNKIKRQNQTFHVQISDAC